jgi:hypothetical protein
MNAKYCHSVSGLADKISGPAANNIFVPYRNRKVRI